MVFLSLFLSCGGRDHHPGLQRTFSRGFVPSPVRRGWNFRALRHPWEVIPSYHYGHTSRVSSDVKDSWSLALFMFYLSFRLLLSCDLYP